MRHSYEPGEEEEEEAESGSSSPPSKRENDSACALADLFGGTFSLSKQKDSLVSLNDQAGDEMKKIQRGKSTGSHWKSALLVEGAPGCFPLTF